MVCPAKARWHFGRRGFAGLRGLLEVIPLDATLVKGSHGRERVPPDERPVLLGHDAPVFNAADVHRAILGAARGE